MEYSKFNTGEKYTLSDIFSKNNKIIIPDMQRDYCWGGIIKDDKTLVETFTQDLIDNQDKNDLNLGLIYGYEEPLGHFQLCDGQQRITTLYLMLGLLNKKSIEDYTKLLISDKELKDDKEPYLLYGIRESSLYFLSDLVSHFFLKKDNIAVTEIYNQPWYFNDYNYDPSIVSMMEAMTTIEKSILELDADKFVNFLSTQISLIYFDMKNRNNGEETFVVINTTGEPLSVTENLKPHLITKQEKEKQEECSKKWEEWETFFWQNRKGNGNKTNDTADSGLKEFFRCITLLNINDNSTIDKIVDSAKFMFNTNFEFNTINEYYEIIKFLFNEKGIFKDNLDWISPDETDKYRNTQIDLFKFLPVVQYVKRFGFENIQNIIRVKRFFNNLAKITNIGSNISTLLPEAIKITKNLPNEDIASILEIKNVSSQILSEEEKLKFNLFINPKYDRIQLENSFWKAEDHKIFNGEILPLLIWSSPDGKFNFELFNKYNDVFCKLFHDDLEYDELDITRRALLTRELIEYPKIFRGNTNYSFCWEYSDWQTLIKENVAKFGSFLFELIDKENIYQLQEEMKLPISSNKDFEVFVKEKELLKFCENKNIQNFGKELGWVLIKKIKATSFANIKSYLLFLEMKSNEFWSDEWKIGFCDKNPTYVFFDRDKNLEEIDIIHIGNDKYQLKLFRREDKEVENFYINIKNRFDLTFNEGKYEKSDLGRDYIIEYTKEIIKEISKS